MEELTIEQLVIGHEQAFVPAKAVGVNTVVQYRLTGEGGGDWIITIQDGKCQVSKGIAEKPKMTMTAEASVFRSVLLGKLDGTTAFMQGKLKISGDLNLAMRFPGFFTK